MRSRRNKPRQARRARRQIDPSFERARATRFANFGASRWYHVLIQFDTSANARSFAQEHPRPQSSQAEAATRIWVPSMYAAPRPEMDGATFCTAIVRVDGLQSLYSGLSRKGIQRIQLGTPIQLGTGWASKVTSVKSALTLSQVAPAGSVVTAVIDDGLAIAHERFRILDKTRIECFWDQVEPNPNPAPNWDYGRELCKYDVGTVAGIDTWLARCMHSGIVDEDEFYLKTGLVDFGSSGHKSTAQRSSHGTHVMDLACGDDPSSVSNDRPIICVQLPRRTTEDTSGATLAPQVLDALWYIADRAGSQPLVVNLSYGVFAGPHDGSSDLETWMQEFIRLRNNVAPTAIVLPAGNSHMARCHARFRLGTGTSSSTFRLDWRVLPDDRTESILEVWLPYRPLVVPKVKVRVIAPGNAMSGWASEGTTLDWGPAGPIVSSIAYAAPSGALGRGRIRITLNPTSATDPGIDLAPAGIWKVEIKNDSGAAIPGIHAWIQRDDEPHGYPVRGRQSRFEDRNYVRFEPSGRDKEDDDPSSYIQRAGSINAIATGDDPVVIGGCRRKDLAAAKYSAGGPAVVRPGSAPPPRLDPDAMTVSDDSVVFHGVLAAGSRSGSVVAISGTSIAAPQIARELAKIIGAGVNPRSYVQALAQMQEGIPRPDPPFKPQPTLDRGGKGRIVLPAIVPVQRYEP
jgi:hypothetical protein